MHDSKPLSGYWRRLSAFVAGHASPACLLALLLAAAPAHAAMSIDSVVLGGAGSIAVPPGTAIPASVTVTNDATLWRSTAWRISTAPGATTCVNTTDHLGATETATESFNITAPNTEGTYNAYFVASSNNSCTGTTASTTLAGSVVVAAPTLTKTASNSSGVIGDVMTFRITVTNPLSVPLSSVVVSDTLPTGINYSTHAVTLGSATRSGQTVTWSIPSIPANGSAQMTLAVSLAQSGTYTNTATSAGATSASATIVVLPNAATHFRLDETAGTWTGAAGEVLDSGGTGLVGRRVTTSSPTTTNAVAPSPTIESQNNSIVGSFCNAGSFDGKAVVTVNSDLKLQYTTKLSATAWIYPTSYPTGSGGNDLNSILSNDQNYEFHINPSGKLFWWWGASNLTSATTIPRNQWTHVAITLDSSSSGGRQRIYINGVQDSNTRAWKGTLATNKCDFYIGGDINTASNCPFNAARNFKGMIDEVKLYNYELSQSEVQADMTQGRLCKGSFDHIRIEHDGNASVCNPETVTIKACLDDKCSSLYTGNVTVNLSPSGWIGGNTFTFDKGVTARQLSLSTAGNVTLGSVNSSPIPSNPTRCFNGSSETCTLNFAAASCAFDAVEPGGNPHARIYTKVAGSPSSSDFGFNLDVLALSNSTTVNTTYTGTVDVDLVDASTSSCPTGTGLTTAQSIKFTGSDKGRKTVSFRSTNAGKNVRVRMRVGSDLPACSSDNFAIRPQQFAVSSNMNNANLTGTPKATAGSAFTLTAATTVAGGYNGTPTIDPTKVSDHLGAAVASGTLTGSFAAGTGTSATGDAFRYLDVGNIQFATDAIVDSSFTAVDQPANLTPDCVVGETSNSLSGGKYGCDIGSAATAKFGRWYPSHYSFSGTLTPSCGTGNFTYMGQDALGVALTVTAHANPTGTPTAADPVVSRYTYSATGYSNVATVSFTGDNNGASVPTNRLTSPALPSPTVTPWSAGQYVINDTFAFSRPGSPETPYEAFKLVAAVADPDGSTLIGSSVQKATNATRLRYGRLRIGSAYGSELLPLAIPYEAQYWTSGGYVTNTDDSCTSFNVSSLVLDNFTQNLAACETRLTPTGSQTLNDGKLALQLTAPGTGNTGSVRLTQNLGASASGNTCVGATSSAATAANMPWFGSNPTGKAAFGGTRAPYIYYRENF